MLKLLIITGLVTVGFNCEAQTAASISAYNTYKYAQQPQIKPAYSSKSPYTYKPQDPAYVTSKNTYKPLDPAYVTSKNTYIPKEPDYIRNQRTK